MAEAQEAQVSSESEGVILDNPPPLRKSRCWFFTWNMDKDDIVNSGGTLAQSFDDCGAIYCFQHERGEAGNDHLQGVVYFRGPKALSALKAYSDAIHWEFCRNKKRAVEYCSKELSLAGQRWVRGFEVEEPIDYVITDLRPWQQELVDILKGRPPERTIRWYWSEAGATGKSAIAKYICLRIGGVLIGSGADAKYAIASMKRKPKILLLNLSRARGARLDYGGLEEIKDGHFFSSKYESGQCIFSPPHVVVFANSPPLDGELSEDRLVVHEIV